MNTSTPAQQQQLVHLPFPYFLGIAPDEGPTRFPRQPFDILCMLIGRFEEHYKDQDPQPSDTQFKRFKKAYLTFPRNDWERATDLFIKYPDHWPPSPHLAWEAYLFNIEPEKTPTRGPQPRPFEEKEKKRNLALIPNTALSNYILKHAPSKSYERIYSAILNHTKNKRSSKGKHVYPYGQDHIAKKTGIPLRTVERAWAWLRAMGILNKAWNENKITQKCAGWYVVTSLKQRLYFMDPANRHRRK